jgi:hypothetical protein
MKKKKEIDRLNALNQRRGQAVERLVTAWWRNHFTGSEQDALEAALRDQANGPRHYAVGAGVQSITCTAAECDGGWLLLNTGTL